MSPITAGTTHNFVQKVELSHKKLNIDPCTPQIDCPAQLSEQDMFHMSSIAVRESEFE